MTHSAKPISPLRRRMIDVSGQTAPSFHLARASAIVVPSIKRQDEGNGKQDSTAASSIPSTVDGADREIRSQ